MLDRFKEVLRVEFDFLKKGQVYLAISGGKDSMVLADLLQKSGVKPVLLHCNFKLRGLESEEDEQFLKKYAEENKLTIFVKHFETEQISEELNLTIQETARKLRYNWFADFLQKDSTSYLLTAHHLDDSIETFFINLMRGTGLTGLKGIPKSNGQIKRPLSRFTTEDVLHYIDANGIDYRRDSSNKSNKYLRNRIRNTIMPQLLEVEPKLKVKMRRLFDELDDIDAWIQEKTNDFYAHHAKENEKNICFDLSIIKEQKSFFLVQLFKIFGLRRNGFIAFKQFLNGHTGGVFKTGTHVFLLDREELIISPVMPEKKIKSIQISELPFIYEDDTLKIKMKLGDTLSISKDNKIQQIDNAKITYPILLRNWEHGDKIRPLGMSGTKLISDILIDKKINQFEKENKYVLVDETGVIIALLGVVISEDYKINPETKDALELILGD